MWLCVLSTGVLIAFPCGCVFCVYVLYLSERVVVSFVCVCVCDCVFFVHVIYLCVRVVVCFVYL